MEAASLKFLKNLLETPSAPGCERAIQDVVRAWCKPLADEVTTDRHGNVIAAIHPSKGRESTQKIMLAGHCDQIALMVQYIDESGYLYVQPMGGWDMQILLGQYLTVWTQSGPVTGVISRRAPHLLTPEERNKVPQFADVWIDIGARDRVEAEELVKVGDTVTVPLGMRELRNGLAAAPAMDDKVGVWTVFETLRLLHTKRPGVSVYCVSTVQEEIGLRGATTSSYGIHPTVGIAVDVCHATDTPGNDKKSVGDVRVGNGPVMFRGPNINPHVYDRLSEAARGAKVRAQTCGNPKATGTDANAIQLARDGVAAGLIGIPNRYMHSPVEVVALADLEGASKMLARFCMSASPQVDWTP